jgi:hypothetical protein
VVRWLEAQGLDPDIHAAAIESDGALLDDCSSDEEGSSEEGRASDGQDLIDEAGSSDEGNSEDNLLEGGEIVRVPQKPYARNSGPV